MTTLVFLAVVATLGFALASLSVQHLSAAASQENRQQALLLGRSAVSMAIARLMKSQPAPGLLQASLPGTRPGAVGLLTFETNRGLAYSTNNLQGDTAVAGWGGRSVPRHAALLIGEGRSGGVVRRVEALLAVPPYPYALASAGPVDARNGVVIAGLPAGSSQLNPDTTGVTLQPADMLSNDAGAQAIFLGAGTRVTGDVKAAGTVRLDPAALIEGRVTNGAAREQIPNIPLANYDPQSGPHTVLTAAPTGPLSGAFRHQGDLNCTQGLQLDAGVVYVDGDLTVSGGLRGKGMVVCTGNLTVNGQTDFQSGNGLAVLAGGDLKVSGSGQAGSFFQGLLYTKGSFEADRVTVVGTMIAASTNANPRVLLDDARVIYNQGGVVSLPPVGGSSGLANLTTGALPPLLLGSRSVNIYVARNNSGGWDGNFTFTWPPANTAVMARPLGATVDQVLFNLRDVLEPIAVQEGSLAELDRWLTGLNLDGGPPGPAPGPAPPPPSLVTFDPSSFLQLVERVRIVMWRES